MNGTVYLLHFDAPFKHARHYCGWAQNLEGGLARCCPVCTSVPRFASR